MENGVGTGGRARWRALAEDWIAAWNARDLDRIMAHYAEDVVFVSPLVTKVLGRPDGTVRGKAALRAYFTAGLARSPDLRFTLVDVLYAPDGVAVVYRNAGGDLVSETMTLDAEGLTVSARVFRQDV